MKKTVTIFFVLITIYELWSQKVTHTCEDYTNIKGHCIVKSNNKFGIMKAKQVLVIPIEFDTLYEYSYADNSYVNSYYIVRINNKYGVYDKNGKQLITPLYDKIEIVFDEKLNQDIFYLTHGSKRIIA